jgi:hypothetical protein
MKCVEGSERDRIEERSACTDALVRLDDGDLRDDSLRLRNRLRYDTTYCTDDLDLDDGARDLVCLALEELTERSPSGSSTTSLTSAVEST